MVADYIKYFSDEQLKMDKESIPKSLKLGVDWEKRGKYISDTEKYGFLLEIDNEIKRRKTNIIIDENYYAGFGDNKFKYTIEVADLAYLLNEKRDLISILGFEKSWELGDKIDLAAENVEEYNELIYVQKEIDKRDKSPNESDDDKAKEEALDGGFIEDNTALFCSDDCVTTSVEDWNVINDAKANGDAIDGGIIVPETSTESTEAYVKLHDDWPLNELNKKNAKFFEENKEPATKLTNDYLKPLGANEWKDIVFNKEPKIGDCDHVVPASENFPEYTLSVSHGNTDDGGRGWVAAMEDVGDSLPEAPEQKTIENDFNTNVNEQLNIIGDLLKKKNEKYGDSALNPTRIFSKSNSVEQILVRIDDKLSRIKTGIGGEDEDVVLDLIGYLILLRIKQGE